jgi:cell division protein FtsW (lipid II flippase)
VVAVVASYVGFQGFDHARLRFMAWRDPFADATGQGWQVLQSLSAMFSGGLWGSGLGMGAPSMVIWSMVFNEVKTMKTKAYSFTWMESP